MKKTAGLDINEKIKNLEIQPFFCKNFRQSAIEEFNKNSDSQMAHESSFFSVNERAAAAKVSADLKAWQKCRTNWVFQHFPAKTPLKGPIFSVKKTTRTSFLSTID